MSGFKDRRSVGDRGIAEVVEEKRAVRRGNLRERRIPRTLAAGKDKESGDARRDKVLSF